MHTLHETVYKNYCIFAPCLFEVGKSQPKKLPIIYIIK